MVSCNFIFFSFENMWHFRKYRNVISGSVETIEIIHLFNYSENCPNQTPRTWRRNESFTINWASIYVIIMANKLKQGSLTIPPFHHSTKHTTTCHLKSLNIKLTTVLEIQIIAWNRQKNVSELNWLGFLRPALQQHILIKQYKTYTDFLSTQKWMTTYTWTVKVNSRVSECL